MRRYLQVCRYRGIGPESGCRGWEVMFESLTQHKSLNLMPVVVTKLLLLFPQLLHRSLTHQTISQLSSLTMPLSPAWLLADQDLTLCGPDSQTWPSYRTNLEFTELRNRRLERERGGATLPLWERNFLMLVPIPVWL